MWRGIKTGAWLVLGLASCLIEAQGQNRPVWVDRPWDPGEGKVYFVGRSSLLDAPDEKTGLQQAWNDVLAQISVSTGIKVRNAEVASGTTSADLGDSSIVTGLQALGNYVEQIRGERRYRYHVLIAVTAEEISRLQEKAKTDSKFRLDQLLVQSRSALDSGETLRARDLLRLAARRYSDSDEAWLALAETEEKLKDWEMAFVAWESLAGHASDPKIQELAKSSLRRIADERAMDLIRQAEQITNDFGAAIDLLVDASDLRPSDRVLGRLRSRYFQLASARLASEISNKARSNEWSLVAIANFTGGTEAEGLSLRDQILGNLQGPKTRAVYLDEAGVRTLQRGPSSDLSEAELRSIRESGAEAVAFGTLSESLLGYLYSVKTAELQPISQPMRMIGKVPGYPRNFESWSRLPSKKLTSRGLRLELWTDKIRYRVGEEVTFYMRSNQDCYVVLVDLQTSGGLYVLYPNHFQRETRLQAGRIQMVPAPNAPFSIAASGPSGTEGVKAIAAIRPLLDGVVLTGDSLMVARTPDAQLALCQAILAPTRSLSDDEWDVAEWTFEVAE